MLVVMLNIMKRNDYTIEECLQIAYNDIQRQKRKNDRRNFCKGSK